VVLL
jgi:hypothetical protein